MASITETSKIDQPSLNQKEYRMKKELFMLAKHGAKTVYKIHFKIWTTEFSITNHRLKSGEFIQRLSIGGTKGLLDWIPNILLFSYKGYKIGDFWSAVRIARSKEFKKYRNPACRLLISGHSRGGGSAVVYMHRYGDKHRDWCVAFNACPSLRRTINRLIPNTYMFYNAYDIISNAGIVNFGHPLTKKYKNKEDLGNQSNNHNLDQWDKFISERSFD